MSEQTLDRGAQVREGEELDIERLGPWLKSQIAGLEVEPQVTQYSGGASNWTYCLAISTVGTCTIKGLKVGRPFAA